MAQGSAPVIELRGVTVGYGASILLSDVDATLPSGRITVLLGESGSGKSTLLRCVLGLKEMQAGDILFDGRTLFSASRCEIQQLRRRMGVLFQDAALLGSLTLGENVALPLREHTRLSRRRIEAIVREKLSLVGLEAAANLYPGQLSGGMRKRAGLARAMAMDPDILLCDEPTSGLDPITATGLDKLIVSLRDRYGMTIVIVTHDLETVFAVADHVVVINRGSILFQGGLDGLLRCECAYIRSFLARASARSETALKCPLPGPGTAPKPDSNRAA